VKLSIDLNADLGEGAGHDDELFEFISSANIATGFHAGDSDTMHAAVSSAKEHGVAVGAHPSFFDRENFGRKEVKVSNEDVFDAVAYQLGIFQAIASALDVQPNHVKPHGALYNMAVRDEDLADAIARAIKSVDPKLIRMRCFVIQTKLPNVCCECCAKAKCAPLKAAMSMCGAKQFAFMAIRRARLSLRVHCENISNAKA
jgi:lactam utilization protein B